MNPPPPPPKPPGSPVGPPAPPVPRPPAKTPALAEATFNSALERPAAERAAYLAEACGTDAELKARVEQLLAAHEQADGFLDRVEAAAPEVTLNLGQFKPEEAGEHIGPYKLLQQIGEGGFGTVWMAEQLQPVRRRVALKIIKLGMDTKEVIARFAQERQALALMDHPNIARVLDAGATQYGRPFFVMELVRGVKITEYCDEQGLSTEERLGLFIHVCQAVQHAHQKGIIHRDLKPSNILVTINDGEPVPKVIDFGVAKATQGHLTDGTLFTQFEQMIGTPLYMSPEQAEMTSLDIDTRSDIYSLGVLLYELLTGRTPIDSASMARAGMDEIRRIIREVDPPRPSARVKTLGGAELTTAAKRRHIDPAKLPGSLRGDLDWIVMKCLEKDRKRRYDTANGLASDLLRHLKNEVVTARPPTAGYLFGKLVRRNKLAFAAGLAIVASLLVGFTVSVWQAVRATRAEQRSSSALEELRATAPAFAEQARALAARERFAEAIEKLDYAVKLRPDVAEYLVAKADLLECQLRLSEAAAVYREALHVAPGLQRAEASAKLCDELLAAPSPTPGKLSSESLARLHREMLAQQRPAAERMPVARLLGEEQSLLRDYWLTRLKDLPVSADRPLGTRLEMRDDGRLLLDLSNTTISDLSPLTGAPLAWLDLGGARQIIDLTPLRDLTLLGLDLSKTGVQDLSPLRNMRSLKALYLAGSKVSDLSPIRDLRLQLLNFELCGVVDLSPIHGMPLEELRLGNTQVTDLSPLIGMPIKTLDLTRAPVVDFSPLAQLPLEKCYLQYNRIADLSVFKGRPLKELALWNCIDARHFSALAEIPTLELLLLPSSYRELPDEELTAIATLRQHPRLRQLGSEIMDQMSYSSTSAKEIFWKDWDTEQRFVPALRARGLKFKMLKLPSGTYSLELFDQPLRDLSILEGAPISSLTAFRCQISDLAPLHNLPLEYLNVSGNPITDLNPLRGKQIKTLYLIETAISDLSPVTGLPLKELYINGCENLTEVTALAGIPTLEKATVPVQAAHIESLRNLPKLQMLAFRTIRDEITLPETTAEEFWKRWPEVAWQQALRSAGVTFSAKPDADATWSLTITGQEFSDLSVLAGGKFHDLILDGTAVTDLSPLIKIPVQVLSLDRTPVSDLTPLATIPLKMLRLRKTRVTDLSVLRGTALGSALEGIWVFRTKITDFSPVAGCTALKVFDATDTALPDLEPLRGRQLREVYFANTKVRDIAILAGMPLKRAFIDGCEIEDVSPLAKCISLEEVMLPKAAQNPEVLRTLQHLTRLSRHYDGSISGPSMTATEFWRAADQKKQEAQAETAFAEGRVEDGLALLTDLATQKPADSVLALKLGSLQAWFAKDDAYAATCARALKAIDQKSAPDVERLAKLLSMRPISDPRLREAALAAGRRCAELAPDHEYLPYFKLSLGMAAYRNERYAEADEALLSCLEIAQRAPGNSYVRPGVGFYRAMCLFKLGKKSEARELLNSTAGEMRKVPADDRNPLADHAMHDDLIFWLAQKEATELLKEPAAK